MTLALLVAGCSTGGGKRASPSTTSVQDARRHALGRYYSGHSTLAGVAANLGPCPKPSRRDVSKVVNPSVPGLGKRLIPISATAARICEYSGVWTYNDSGLYPAATKLVGSSILPSSAASRLEDATNRLPQLSGGAPSCPPPPPDLPFDDATVLTFADAARQVEVGTAYYCYGGVSNGTIARRPTSQWQSELRSLTRDVPVPPGLPSNDGGRGTTGATGTTPSDRATCTSADLVKGAFVMPASRVVEHDVTFDSGQNILEPPTDRNPPISAARAWQIATRFGLLIPPVHGTYELLLGNLTSIHNYLHHPVWVVIGHDVPTVPISGGPVPPPGVTQPPRPPCYFSNVVQPIDATTGQSLFVESGSIDVP